MAKQKTPPAAPPAAPVAPVSPTITVIGGTFRPNSARAKWYALVVQYNGKTVAEFTAAALAAPPSQPEKGKLKGITEPITGWLNFWVREKHISLS